MVSGLGIWEFKLLGMEFESLRGTVGSVPSSLLLSRKCGIPSAALGLGLHASKLGRPNLEKMTLLKPTMKLKALLSKRTARASEIRDAALFG